MNEEQLRDTSYKGVLSFYTKKGDKMAKANKMTKKRVEEIATFLRNEFDPKNTTSLGHSKYAKAKLKEAENLELQYKEDKGVFVTIGSQRVSIADLDTDHLQTIIDHKDNLNLIADELGTTKQVSTAATI